MPLQIKLPAKERIIVNGAVIENGATPATLILHTRADILRRRDVMSEEEACTPARLVYYALQCAYIFEDERTRYLDMFKELAATYEQAAPSAKSLLDQTRDLVATGALYKALRCVHALLDHERERFESVQYTPPTKRLSQATPPATANPSTVTPSAPDTPAADPTPPAPPARTATNPKPAAKAVSTSPTQPATPKPATGTQPQGTQSQGTQPQGTQPQGTQPQGSPAKPGSDTAPAATKRRPRRTSYVVRRES